MQCKWVIQIVFISVMVFFLTLVVGSKEAYARVDADTINNTYEDAVIQRRTDQPEEPASQSVLHGIDRVQTKFGDDFDLIQFPELGLEFLDTEPTPVEKMQFYAMMSEKNKPAALAWIDQNITDKQDYLDFLLLFISQRRHEIEEHAYQKSKKKQVLENFSRELENNIIKPVIASAFGYGTDGIALSHFYFDLAERVSEITDTELLKHIDKSAVAKHLVRHLEADPKDAFALKTALSVASFDNYDQEVQKRLEKLEHRFEGDTSLLAKALATALAPVRSFLNFCRHSLAF